MLHAKKNKRETSDAKKGLPAHQRAVPFFAVPQRGRLKAEFFLFGRTKIVFQPSNHCNDQKVRTLLQGENL